MSMSVRGSGARGDNTYCSGIFGAVTGTKLLTGWGPSAATTNMSHAISDHNCDNDSGEQRDLARKMQGLISLISVNGDYLAESSAEGSIPSPQRRHHVDLNRTTGAADRTVSRSGGRDLRRF